VNLVKLFLGRQRQGNEEIEWRGHPEVTAQNWYSF